jgi:hypothetical protein
MEVFQRDEYFAVVGTLHDERPWASGDYSPRDLHFMDLGLVVRRADMMIVDAAADMRTFPHAECTEIEPTFRDLIGLSVARGYSGAVQERFGRQRGCSHLEFLARAIGPVVVQGVTSSPPGRSKEAMASTRCARAASASWPTRATCGPRTEPARRRSRSAGGRVSSATRRPPSTTSAAA